ncbi:glycoside hydrolase family 25 protein, partial [Lactarius akahatsu]
MLVKRALPQGIDVSNFQGTQATEGTTFIDPNFSSNYVGAKNAGVIRGAYHFANPDTSSGAVQADFFLAHGGEWSGDGITLPGALDLDLEGTCYGLTAAQMVAWIDELSNTYHSATASSEHLIAFTDVWASCTGNSTAFSSHPLWIVHWATTIGTLPTSWGNTTFWQYAAIGPVPGDQDRFNGDVARL